MKRTRAAVLGTNLLVLLIASFVPAQDITVVKEPVEHIFAVQGGVELKAYVFFGE